MQMTTEARAWLDATVRRILARHPLGDAERAGITYELMSHLHAAGEAHATAAGRTEVAREDLEAALAQSGGEDGLAAAFVQPLAKPIRRAGLAPRLGAFAIDVVVILFVHGSLAFLLAPGAAGMEQPEEVDTLWFFMPWGFHDATLPLLVQAAIAAGSAAAVLGYFTWLEGRDGRTVGKRALDLRVMRVDGAPMTYRESLLRNVVKLSPPLLFLDTLFMLLGRDAKRRVSDKLAETIVVRE